jgi:hypothetical protein
MHEETRRGETTYAKRIYRLTDLLSQEFSLLKIVQSGFGVHPTSYPMGTGSSFPGVKRSGREADNSPPTSAEVKKMWIYISTPQYAFMA